MSLSPPKGTYDVVPQDNKNPWRSSAKWDAVESAAAESARLFGCMRMRTPIFEHLELFARSVGESSDIVSKEMYQFEDRSGRKLALRPEGTASAVRAAINARLYETPFTRLFYIGPMFRYERPQAGRFRQHQQFGVELLGSPSPEVDVEAIELMLTFYEMIGLKNLTLNINSLGTKACQAAYSSALETYLTDHQEALSADSKRRLTTNPLRILDSKDPADQEVLKNAPKILDLLSDEAKVHLKAVQTLLDDAGIAYVMNTNLVRGLDYYTHTVFEVTSDALGAQNAIGGGGRYDGLVQELGGPSIPAVGFATGLERVITTAIAQELPTEDQHAPQITLFAIDRDTQSLTFSLARKLRLAGIRTVVERKSKRVGDAVSRASRLNSKYFLALGTKEIESDIVKVKDLAKREEHEMPLDSVEPFILKGGL